MKYYYSIDVAKFICAIFVVLIHTTAYLYTNGIATFENYYIYRSFLDIAVPFFFATSGFFLAFKNKEYVIIYSKKILYLYIIFSAFYMFFDLLFALWYRFAYGTPLIPSLGKLFSKWNLETILNGNIGSYHLWFLSALLFSSIFLYLLYNWNKTVIIFIAIILYCIDSMRIFDFGNLFAHGGMIKGFLFVSLGFYIARKDVENVKRPYIWLTLSMLLYFSFNYVFPSGMKEIFLYLSTFYLIVWCKQTPSKKSYFSKLGKSSLGIYILHVVIIEIMIEVCKYFENVYFNNLFFYLILSTISVAIPLLVFRYFQKMLDRIFKVPYNHFFN